MLSSLFKSGLNAGTLISGEPLEEDEIMDFVNGNRWIGILGTEKGSRFCQVLTSCPMKIGQWEVQAGETACELLIRPFEGAALIEGETVTAVVDGQQVSFGLAQYERSCWKVNPAAWVGQEPLPSWLRWDTEDRKFFGFVQINESTAAAMKAGLVKEFSDYPAQLKKILVALFGAIDMSRRKFSLSLTEEADRNSAEGHIGLDGTACPTFFSAGKRGQVSHWVDPLTGETGPMFY